MLVSVVAVAAQGAVSAGMGVVAALLIPAGFLVSHHRRGRGNVLLKLALVVGLFAAFGGFLGSVRGATSIDDTRVPLAALFLWVQVLHSFDVPRRRDLAFSVASSVALIALAGSLAFSSDFAVLLLLYAVALCAALVTGHLAELQATAAGPLATEVPVPGARATAGSGPGILRPAAATLALTLACAAVVFVALPRLPGLKVASLPVSIARHAPIPEFTGGVLRPPRSGGGGTGTTGFRPDVYFGYGEEVDLGLRGRLSDELVMRVRAPEPALWRGQVFDVYDGRRWTSSAQDFVPLRAGLDDSIPVPSGAETEHGATREVVQTFYVEHPLPNIVFHAHRAREVFVPSTTAHVDDFRSIRLPFVIEEHTIYSVISDVPDITAEELEFAAPVDPDHPGMARYLQVPDTLGDHFTALARSITDPHPTQQQKVQAVEDWLERTKEYRLDIPRDPPGRDPVEVFLFEREEGFCEQIASSMVLLLRASGVPARLVTGFGPGERNVFTGYWEVRNSDAHAWVEVYYPGTGWVPYDPTFGVPLSDAANTTFLFGPLSRLAQRALPTDAIRGLADALGGPAAAAGLTAVLLLAGSAVALGTGRRRRTYRRPAAGEAGRVLSAWFAVSDELTRRGCRRRPEETVRDFARRARREPGVDQAAFDALVAAFHRARYGPGPVREIDATEAERLGAALIDRLRREQTPVFATRRSTT